MDGKKREALQKILLILADNPELIEGLNIKPNKILKQSQSKAKSQIKT